MRCNNDRQVLRGLAEKLLELAHLPVMNDRKNLWTKLKDLKAERPMILVEIDTIEDYVPESELRCVDPVLRNIELQMRWDIRHAEEVGDDIVIEPFIEIGWQVHFSDFGLRLDSTHGIDNQGHSWGFSVKNPVKTPEDISKLIPRSFSVDREKTLMLRDKLLDAFGDILPVGINGSRMFYLGLTRDLFNFIGMEKMMLWLYDEPEALHRIMAFLRDDRIACFKWMERERLLGLNNRNQIVASGSPGYVTGLPAADYNGVARLKDIWFWPESQETVSISPASFNEFILPYLADISKLFGLVYYGCCEPVHDRWEYIRKAIPNIRTVSVSPWCDVNKMAEMLGKDFVFSRKTLPSYISGDTPDWDALRKDISNAYRAASGCNLEFIFRDIMRLNGDRGRLSRLVDMTRSIIGASL